LKIPEGEGILKKDLAEILREGEIMTFFSRPMKVAEKNYITIKRELLAMMT
jgi:hypothetical protein